MSRNIAPTPRMDDSGVESAVWENVAAGDVCLPWKRSGKADKTFHIYGAPSGASVKLFGSNDIRAQVDHTTAAWAQLRDPERNLINVTSVSDGTNLDVIHANPAYIMPQVVDGDVNTLLNIAICGS